MEYLIISANDRFEQEAREKLQKEVNARLKAGWVLQGGVSTYATYSEYHQVHYAAQALVKYPVHPTINIE